MTEKRLSSVFQPHERAYDRLHENKIPNEKQNIHEKTPETQTTHDKQKNPLQTKYPGHIH